MRKIELKDAQEIPVDKLPGIIQTGIEVAAEAAAPILKTLFQRLNEWLKTLGKNNPDSPANVRLRLKLMESKDELQKKVNSHLQQQLNALEERVTALEQEEALEEALEQVEQAPSANGAEKANVPMFHFYNGKERRSIERSDKAGIKKALKDGLKRISPEYNNILKAKEVAAE